MTKEEIDNLVEKYFRAEGYKFPTEFEHRLDPNSSAIMYSLIRQIKPRVCVEIGSWLGGSTCLIMMALLCNRNKFTFITSEKEDDLRKKTYENVYANCGRFPIAVGDITKSLGHMPLKIDFLFVDTNHDRETAEWIVSHLWPRLVPGALFAMHDWAVKEVEGKLVGKGAGGAGGTPETEFLMELYQRGKFPFEKIYWAWEYGSEEIAFWRKK